MFSISHPITFTMTNGSFVNSVADYVAEDPLAVSVTFSPGEGEDSTWILGRDLLLEALSGEEGRSVGEGDVKCILMGERLFLQLSSPDGHATLSAPRSEMDNFIKLTLATVPQGQEFSAIDMDRELAVLLS